MELRDLNASDVWQLVRILGKIGIRDFAAMLDKDDLEALSYSPPTMMKNGKKVPLPVDKYTEAQIERATRAELAEGRVMYKALGFLMEHISDCEDDVQKLLASGTGESVEAIKTMDAIAYIELLEQYITRDGFSDFFMRAWGLLERASTSSTASTVGMAMLTS